MLIRCIYVDAIYLVSIFWLTPLFVFVLFCAMMQAVLVCHTQLKLHQPHHLTATRPEHQTSRSPEKEVKHPSPQKARTSSDCRHTAVFSQRPDTCEDIIQEFEPKEPLLDIPILTRWKVFCLLGIQFVLTLTMLPFLVFQLLDMMNVPADPLHFWLTSSGQITLTFLQTLPALNFVLQPFFLLSSERHDVTHHTSARDRHGGYTCANTVITAI